MKRYLDSTLSIFSAIFPESHCMDSNLSASFFSLYFLFETIIANDTDKMHSSVTSKGKIRLKSISVTSLEKQQHLVF